MFCLPIRACRMDLDLRMLCYGLRYSYIEEETRVIVNLLCGYVHFVYYFIIVIIALKSSWLYLWS